MKEQEKNSGSELDRQYKSNNSLDVIPRLICSVSSSYDSSSDNNGSGKNHISFNINHKRHSGMLCRMSEFPHSKEEESGNDTPDIIRIEDTTMHNIQLDNDMRNLQVSFHPDADVILKKNKSI